MKLLPLAAKSSIFERRNYTLHRPHNYRKRVNLVCNAEIECELIKTQGRQVINRSVVSGQWLARHWAGRCCPQGLLTEGAHLLPDGSPCRVPKIPQLLRQLRSASRARHLARGVTKGDIDRLSTMGAQDKAAGAMQRGLSADRRHTVPRFFGPLIVVLE